MDQRLLLPNVNDYSMHLLTFCEDDICLLWVEGELCDEGPGRDGQEGQQPAHQQVQRVVPLRVGQEHVHHEDVVHVQPLSTQQHVVGWWDHSIGGWMKGKMSSPKFKPLILFQLET